MTADTLRDKIDSLASHILFDYNGKHCGVDPINRQHIEMWCGDSSKTAESVDAAMTFPLFDGKSLLHIIDTITNIED